MNKPTDIAGCFDASNCYAMIVYQSPSWFTTFEQAKWDNGTPAERAEVLTTVCIRALGIPSQLMESENTNYSSAKLDAERFKNVIGRRVD